MFCFFSSPFWPNLIWRCPTWLMFEIVSCSIYVLAHQYRRGRLRAQGSRTRAFCLAYLREPRKARPNLGQSLADDLPAQTAPHFLPRYGPKSSKAGKPQSPLGHSWRTQNRGKSRKNRHRLFRMQNLKRIRPNGNVKIPKTNQARWRVFVAKRCWDVRPS